MRRHADNPDGQPALQACSRTCSTVLELSMRYGCGNRAISCAIFCARPSAILARMASGFVLMSSRCISNCAPKEPQGQGNKNTYACCCLGYDVRQMRYGCNSVFGRDFSRPVKKSDDKLMPMMILVSFVGSNHKLVQAATQAVRGMQNF